jgi:hypothetical protein
MSEQPTAAVIEIVEKARATDDTMGGSIIIPNEVRINGVPLLMPANKPIIVHEMQITPKDAVYVTLTLLARRVTIAADGDIHPAAAQEDGG